MDPFSLDSSEARLNDPHGSNTGQHVLTDPNTIIFVIVIYMMCRLHIHIPFHEVNDMAIYQKYVCLFMQHVAVSSMSPVMDPFSAARKKKEECDNND